MLAATSQQSLGPSANPVTDDLYAFDLPRLAATWSEAEGVRLPTWADAMAIAAGVPWVGLLYGPVAASIGLEAPRPTWQPIGANGPCALPGLPPGAALLGRLFVPPARHPGVVVLVTVPSMAPAEPIVPAPRTDSRGGQDHRQPLEQWLGAIDTAWRPFELLLSQALVAACDSQQRAGAEREALERLDWLEQALCYAREVVWELDVPSRTLRYSRYVAALVLDDTQSDLPMTLESFLSSMHPDDRAPTQRCLDDYLQGNASECYFEYRQRHRDGHWIWSRSRGRALTRDAQGRPLRVLGTAVGISAQKNLEGSLRESEQRLRRSEAQLREREAQLQVALAQAQGAARERTQFLATMSHEIRTPLNSIVGASRLALMESSPQLVAEHLALINDASDHLMRLVNSVLDHSRLQAGSVALELRPVDLRRLLKDQLRQFTPAAQARGLSLTVWSSPDLPATVHADALRLTQVISNLMSNALRFTHVGGVEVRAEVLEAGALGGSPCQVRISVRDTGIGMTPQQCGRLFQAYGQADETIARRYGGTGLGLAISHRLVELMGGELRVESCAGVGSVFSFDCALQWADSGDSPSTVDRSSVEFTESMRALRGSRVLVVDDNPMNIFVVRRFLDRAGLSVQATPSAQEALQLLDRERFDAVLMDLYMPEMSGADATRILRQDPRFMALPVLALSASVTPEERELCRQAGMDAFIPKPLDADLLINTLATLCARLDRTVSPGSTASETVTGRAANAADPAAPQR